MIPHARYVVIERDRLMNMLSVNIKLIDQIKVAIIHDLVDEGCTMNDALLIFAKYGIDYQARRAVIAIKRSIIERKELPDEISFVTLDTQEIPKIWGC